MTKLTSPGVNIALVCAHGVPTGTACLACHQPKTQLPGALELCPHSYANPANCPDCTPRPPAKSRRRPTPAPPVVNAADCATCSLSYTQHNTANALVAVEDRHDYQPKKAAHAPLI